MKTMMGPAVLLAILVLCTAVSAATPITVLYGNKPVPYAAVVISTLGKTKDVVDSGSTEPNGVFLAGKKRSLRQRCLEINPDACDELTVMVIKGELMGRTNITWTGSGWDPSPVEVPIAKPAAVQAWPTHPRERLYYKYTPLYVWDTVCRPVYCDGTVRLVPETRLSIVWTRETVPESEVPPYARATNGRPAGTHSPPICKSPPYQTLPTPQVRIGPCCEPCLPCFPPASCTLSPPCLEY